MKVLIADDDPVSLRVLQSSLAGWDFEVVEAHDGEHAWEILTGLQAPRLAILDWMMPKMDGVTLCTRLRQHSIEPYTYVILMTVRGDTNDLVYAMGAGADDCLTKPFNPQELEIRLLTGKRILGLQQQLATARGLLENCSVKDDLTGLLNRSAIMDVLCAELCRERRSGIPLGLVLADLDHFRRVNDVHGSGVGDRVLKTTADRMRSHVRAYDSLGRWGGEEFLLVLPGCSAAAALCVAERMRRSVSEQRDELIDVDPPVTVSLGVTSSQEARDKTPQALIAAAEQALSRAKANGCNRVEPARRVVPPAR